MAHRSGLRRTLTHEQLVSIPWEEEKSIEPSSFRSYLYAYILENSVSVFLRFFLYFHRGPALFCFCLV